MKAVHHKQLIGCLTAFLVVALVAALAGPQASALVYWTTQGGDVGRANLNGGVVDTEWISTSGRPTGITVNSSYVYFTRYISDTVARANIDGTGLDDDWVPATSVDGPNGVAVDGSYVYWANTVDGYIGRANLDGTSPDNDWITGGTNPTGIAVDSNYIYWTNLSADTIGRADIDGTNVTDSFITGASSPSGIAVDGSYIYWTNYGSSGTISRSNLAGTVVTSSFIHNVVNAIGMTVDANYIYWTTTDDIGRAAIDGSGADIDWIADVGSNTRGVAVDATATPVTLLTFAARGIRGDVKVLWETAAEIDTAGFHVWRKSSKDGEFERVTGSMIPAEGGPFYGASYFWVDTDVEPGVQYLYKLEDLDYAGISAYHGPVRAVINKKK